MEPRPDQWTDKRLDLLRSLQQVDATIGALYKRAVDALSEPAFTSSSLVMLSHCVREIANALPDILKDVDGLPARSDVSASAQDLARVWQRYASLVGGHEVPVVVGEALGSDTAPQSTVAVPAQLLESARLVVSASMIGSRNARIRIAALVLGRYDGGRDASVELFRRALQYFVDRAHLNRKVSSEVPSREEAALNLELIERALAARLGSFFDVADELLALLAMANEQTVEGTQ